jgi:2-polyprenyl-6-methoxyphenol hydroxylase-like FAD-dependent oxidoreductase
VNARYDALVIGGGVAGSTVAILLASSGWSVALVERRAFPRRKVCGECVAAPNLELLDALGVGRAFDALAGPPLERVALYAGDDEVRADMPRLRGVPSPWGRALGRERLDTLLIERAAELGAEVWQPWTVVDVARRDGVHECTLVTSRAGGSTTVAAPVLIDAHGSWEPAPAAGVRARGRSDASDLFAFKANFAGANLEPGLLPVLAFDGGYGGMVIGDGGALTLACCVRRDKLRDARAEAPGLPAGLAVEALLERSCGGVRRALHGAQRTGPWLSVGPIRPGRRELWTERGGFAVGNAAGEAHPILGEGISMAIQGAFLLCARLEQRRDELLAGAPQDDVARRYARDWRRAFGARLRWAALFAGLAVRPRARTLLPLLGRCPSLLTAAAIVGGKVRRAPTSTVPRRARGERERTDGQATRAKVTTGSAAAFRWRGNQ